MLKAVLSSNARGIAVCKSKAHKSWVMKNLEQFVAVHRLVNYDHMPTKPPEVTAWEEKHRSASATSSTTYFPPAAPALSIVQTAILSPEPAIRNSSRSLPSPSLLAGFGGGKL